MADDEWGNLFAQAADLPSTSSALVDDAPVKRSKKINDKGRKSNKRRRDQTDASNNRKPYIQMVEGRVRSVHPATPWPHWFSIGEGFFPDSSSGQKCEGWKNSAADGSKEQSMKCQNCGGPAFLHLLQVPDNVDDVHRLFQMIRNLRCVAVVLAERYEPTQLLSRDMVKRIREMLDGQSSTLDLLRTSALRLLPPEEVEILSPKLRHVVDIAHTLQDSIEYPDRQSEYRKGDGIKDKKSRKGVSSNDGKVHSDLSHWDSVIRLIKACDAVYYRLYYLQLTKTIPNCQFDEKECYFPHPLEYFQLRGLTLNTTALMAEADLEGKDSSMKHPLEQIHHLRQLETKALFETSGWMSSAKSATLISLNQTTHDGDPELKHQTPAPQVQMEWRDGCRDLLCNLYAYATISSSVLNQMMLFLEGNKALVGGGIVEIGAGTGYIAQLLQGRGVSVEPWDIQPPNTESRVINEYHGQTPTFVTVKKCSRLPNESFGNKALMLCYPPPGSSMAFDALTEYTRNGGNCLIHIGEFKGLTGDTRFEALLAKTMTCYFREPCLTWGTDASHVTFWIKNGVPVTGTNCEGSKLLLPCSNCRIREATKCCRLERNLVYCSRKCFDEDTRRVDESFNLFCVPLQRRDVQFDDDKHFMTL
jgi:hypothetical protein